jgi:hypothetical protein
MSKVNIKQDEEDGNATLEAIYGKVEKYEENKNSKEEEEKKEEEKEEEKKDLEEDSEEENNKIFKDKLKKHKNFDKRGQKFNKSKNRNAGNKRYETYNNYD